MSNIRIFEVGDILESEERYGLRVMAEEFADFYNETLDEGWTYEVAEEYLLQLRELAGRFFLFAFDLGGGHYESVGFVGARVKPKGSGKILADPEIFVREKYRGTGLHVGEQLYKELFARARKMGIRTMEGVTYANEKGQPLNWYKNGFPGAEFYPELVNFSVPTDALGGE